MQSSVWQWGQVQEIGKVQMPNWLFRACLSDKGGEKEEEKGEEEGGKEGQEGK